MARGRCGGIAFSQAAPPGVIADSQCGAWGAVIRETHAIQATETAPTSSGGPVPLRAGWEGRTLNPHPQKSPQSPQSPESPQAPQSSRPSGGGDAGPGGPLAWWRHALWLLLVVAVAWYWLGSGTGQGVAEIPYTEFKRRVADGEVAAVTFRGEVLTGRFATEAEGDGEADGEADGQADGEADGERGEQGAPTAMETGAAGPQRFRTALPPIGDPELIGLLEDNGVTVRAEPQEPAWWMRALVGILPWLLILGLIWYAARRMQERMGGGQGPGGIFGFRQSRAKRFTHGESDITFDDVAGLDNAKRDLQEIAGFLREPKRYRSLGAKVPRGILLMGPPGTGKTLLARAVAGEAEVPFFSISGSEFIEMFVGVGASRVRDMFKSAKESAPSIIFIDEIDSVGRARGTGVGGGHDEREQTLNQILGEMDGFDPHEAVVVLAATNRPDVLDQALLRPGRFDRKVTLDLPDRRARKSILEIHTADMPLADDVDLKRLAALTVTFSGADIENLVNEAALLAGREKREEIDMEFLLAARDKVVLGGKREMLIEDEEKALIACHEAGHAVAATFLPHADPLDKVTIIPRGRALGATEQIPDEERHNLPEDYLRDRIGVMLGGRVAEQLVYGQVTSGSAQDLKQATGLARRMVSQWGMSRKLGAAAFSRGEDHVFLGKEMTQERNFSEHTARIIDDEICSLVTGIEDRVREIMEDKRDRLKALADALVEQEALNADAVEEILRP